MTEETERKETLKEFQERVRKEYGPMYYDRQGKEMELMEWGRKCEDLDYKILKQESVGRWWISTVWVGLNMQMFRKAPIQIFETMIFTEEKDKDLKEDPLAFYQERYSTEAEAFEGHEQAVMICRAQLHIEQRIKSQVEENAKDSPQEDRAPST